MFLRELRRALWSMDMSMAKGLHRVVLDERALWDPAMESAGFDGGSFSNTSGRRAISRNKEFETATHEKATTTTTGLVAIFLWWLGNQRTASSGVGARVPHSWAAPRDSGCPRCLRTCAVLLFRVPRSRSV